MLRAGEHAQLGEHLASDGVLRQHAFHGVLDDERGIQLTHLGKAAVALATNVARERHVLVLLFLAAGHGDLFRIDDDDVIARINVRSVGGFIAATDDIGGLHRETAKHNVLGIDKIPLGLRESLLLGEKRFHEKRGLELEVERSVSTALMDIFIETKTRPLFSTGDGL